MEDKRVNSGNQETDPWHSEIVISKDNISDAVVDEVQRRMDAVVGAAVAWHQGGNSEWWAEEESLETAVERLLELRSQPNPSTQDSGSASGLATTVPDNSPASLKESELDSQVASVQGKLLPCPFCGALPDRFEDEEIQCSNKGCFARLSVKWGGTSAWNTRAPNSIKVRKTIKCDEEKNSRYES